MLIIGPLATLFEMLFEMLYGILESPIPAILALSIVVNFMTLPLYLKADAIQRAERNKSKKMKPGMDHIRKTFKGDERMMLQMAYYKVEHYSPIYVLREALPLFLQIPLFIAAYRYISSLTTLDGVSFGPIKNLLAPDALLQIGTFSINLLPILMTAVNIAASAVYTKGESFSQKIQPYGLALVFLVLLYKSPAALVIYWLMNNVFSLGKNIYMESSEKFKQNFSVLFPGAIVLLLVFCFMKGNIDTNLDILTGGVIAAGSIILLLAVYWKEKNKKLPASVEALFSPVANLDLKTAVPNIILTGACFAVLMGLYIPSSVLASSVAEFIDRSDFSFPWNLLTTPMLLYIGFFLIWMTIFVLSGNKKNVGKFAAAFWAVLGIALLNQMLFDPRTGALYTNLTFDGDLRYSLIYKAANTLACIAVGVGMYIAFIKKPVLAKNITAILTMVLLLVSVKNVWSIRSDVKKISAAESVSDSSANTLTLSRNGQNVIVFMIDRAIGGYVPYVFDEKPELEDSFSGFTYYRNTVSFGPYTNFSVPSLFGGYEYTPDEMNKRGDELLKDKHDEALKVMPQLFLENGYDVTVCDLPYANYKWTPDMSIFDEYEGVKAYNLTGKFISKHKDLEPESFAEQQKMNFVMYSLFRVVPLNMKAGIYNEGAYLSTVGRMNLATKNFLAEYTTMLELPDITVIEDSDEGSFLMMQNGLPHQPTLLNEPDYVYDGSPVDDTVEFRNHTVDGQTMLIATKFQQAHYCVNIASYELLADWLDYMKANGVYDNTRIIIASDHGRDLAQFDELLHPEGLDVEFVWPVLLVKDFNASGPLTVSDEFMTLADVPSIAMEGVVADRTNPFTGNVIDNTGKKDGDILIVESNNWVVDAKRTTFDTSDGTWWTVHDNIFDMDNWKKVG